LGIFFNGIIATLQAIPIVRYVLSPVTRSSKVGYETWLPVGSLDRFPAGPTRLGTFRNPDVQPGDGKTADSACWVRRIDDRTFQGFANNCMHLGCPFRWFPQSGLFMCPCHGGVYYEDGARASGPPERGLFACPYKIEEGRSSLKLANCPLLQVTAIPAPSWI
jgi:Rieske Fe-S protein